MGRARAKKSVKNKRAFAKDTPQFDHMFTLTSVITKKLNSRIGGKVYVAFVDYKKAFDTVNREALWDVLQKITNIFRNDHGSNSYVQLCQVVCQVGCKPITVFLMPTRGETRVSLKSSYFLYPDIGSS